MAVESTPLSVSQLTAQIKYSLSELFSGLLVRGEVSDLTRARSGHLYFNLKDDSAKISAVMWKSSADRLRFNLEEGLEVICHGEIDVYAPRGSYQLNVRRMDPEGVGGLQLAFEQLKKKLHAEGLFDPARKRTLPYLPRRIGVVTSPQGAAIRDFLQVLERRFQRVEVTIFPCKVQGPGAAQEITRAIGLANRVKPALDVLVVCRGGGSLEDLWCFNEEPVVRGIAKSNIPVITGIGHEVDVTLADFAADVRALTPSEAAERLLPKYSELIASLDQTQSRLKQALANRHQHARQWIDALAQRPCFQFPLERIHLLRQRVDDLEKNLNRLTQDNLTSRRQDILGIAKALHALSPLATLQRGFSVTLGPDGGVVRNTSQLLPDDIIVSRLSSGSIRSRILDLIQENNP